MNAQIFIKKASNAERNRAAQSTLRHYANDFASEDEARVFLRGIIVPASLRWAFVSIGKNASTSVLRFLFRAEFGHDLTALFDSPTDINPSAVVHELAEADVFQRALYVPLSASEMLAIPNMLRMAVVRNPFTRAVSSFNYFCKSNESRKSWFLADRLRINALMGFDWNTMPYTTQGFMVFLEYIAHEYQRLDAAQINAHWRTQCDFIRPAVFQPTLLGRFEQLEDFYGQLCERLGVTIPHMASRIPENRQAVDADGYLSNPAARRLIERIYARDFSDLGY